MDIREILLNIVVIFALTPFLFKMFETAMRNETEIYVTETNVLQSRYILAFVPTIGYAFYTLYLNGASLSVVMNLIIAMALGWSCVVDFKHQELPDTSTAIFLVLTLGKWFGYTGETQLTQLICLVGTLTVLILVWRFLGCLGFGDIKLIVPILLYLSPSLYLAYLGNTLITAFIYAICLIVFKKAAEDRRFAFGPFLIYGFYLTLLGFDFISLLSNVILNFI